MVALLHLVDERLGGAKRSRWGQVPAEAVCTLRAWPSQTPKTRYWLVPWAGYWPLAEEDGMVCTVPATGSPTRLARILRMMGKATRT